MMRILRKGDSYALKKARGKNIYLSIYSRRLVGLLTLIFCLLFSSYAQESRDGGAMSEQIRPLEVGQQVPDEFWTDSIAIYENGEIIKTTFGFYRGKPLLLDFWATWCSTCIAYMPELYILDAYKNNELEIFPVTTEEGIKITAFVDRVERLNQLPFRTVVENEVLAKYFKHYSVPYYVLLNEDGMVQTMVGLAEMNEVLVSSLIENKHKTFESELAKDFRNFPSLLVNRYSEDPNYHYSFFYLGYNKVFGGGNRKRSIGELPYSLTMLNVPVGGILRTLARTKYHRDRIPYHYSFVIYESLSEQDKLTLDTKATFEIAVPKGSGEDIIERSLTELNEVLPFVAKLEERTVDMLVIYKLSESIGLINKEDLSFSILATKLNRIYNEGELFIDVRKEKTDLAIEDVKQDIVALEHDLKNKGLGIRRERLNFPFLVIGK